MLCRLISTNSWTEIVNKEIKWPDTIDPICKDLIEQLLAVDPKERLGALDTTNDMNALMQHPFFEGIDFKSDLTQLEIKEMLEIHLQSN